MSKVVYILNVTSKSPREVCILYNTCTPWANETEPSNTPVYQTPSTNKSPSGGWKSTSGIDSRESRASGYANTIQMLHVTDIHFDTWYAEVTNYM